MEVVGGGVDGLNEMDSTGGVRFAKWLVFPFYTSFFLKKEALLDVSVVVLLQLS